MLLQRQLFRQGCCWWWCWGGNIVPSSSLLLLVLVVLLLLCSTIRTTMADSGIYQLNSGSTIPGTQWIYDTYQQLQTSANVPIRLYDTPIRNRTTVLQQLVQFQQQQQQQSSSSLIQSEQDYVQNGPPTFLITDHALSTTEYNAFHRDTTTTTTTSSSSSSSDSGGLVQLPILATSVNFYVNLPVSLLLSTSSPTPIQLDGCLVAKIMTRTIVSWDDPQILVLNPQLQKISSVNSNDTSTTTTSSAVPITVVVPELSSSASYVVTKYLHEWCPSEFPANYVSDVPPWVSTLISYTTDDDTNSNTNTTTTTDDDAFGNINDINNNNNNNKATNVTTEKLYEEVQQVVDTMDDSNSSNHHHPNRRGGEFRKLLNNNDDYTTNGSAAILSSSSSSLLGSDYFVVWDGTTKDVLQFMKAIPGSIGYAERPVVINAGLMSSNIQEIQLLLVLGNDNEYRTSSDIYPEGIQNAVTRNDFPKHVTDDYNGTQFVTTRNSTLDSTALDNSNNNNNNEASTTLPTWPMVLVTYIIVPKDLSKIIPDHVERSLLLALLEVMTSTVDMFESICCTINNGGYVPLVDEKIQTFVQQGIELLKNYPANNYTGSTMDRTNWIFTDSDTNNNKDTTAKFVFNLNRINPDITSRTRMKQDISSIQSNQKSYNNSITVLQGQITMLQQQVADYQQQQQHTNTIALIVGCISFSSLFILGTYWGWKRYYNNSNKRNNSYDFNMDTDNDCVLCRYQRRTNVHNHMKNRRMFGGRTGCGTTHDTMMGGMNTNNSSSSRSYSFSTERNEEIHSLTTTTTSRSSSNNNNSPSSSFLLSPPPSRKKKERRQAIAASYFGTGPPITTSDRRDSLPGRQDDDPII